jgi:protein-tyrosine phosphatase
MLSPKCRLAFPNLLNGRDLGGYVTRDGEQTRWKSLLRADDLVRLTSEGVEALLDYGVRTVIDLRWPAEAESRPSAFQLDPNLAQYVHISLLGKSSEAWRSLRPEVTKEMWNCAVLDCAQNALCEVMRTIAHASEDGVLFHCVSGKDRTGVVAAVLLALADVVPEAIAYDYALTTDNLLDAYLAANPDDERGTILESVRCPPEQVYNMLAHLDANYGGSLRVTVHR